MIWQRLKTRAGRPLKFVGVGFSMTVINAIVLWVLVSGLGIFPALANLLRVGFTTQIHFWLHRKFTWKGEHVTAFWQQWRRFHVVKAGMTATNQLCFLGLTAWIRMPYMLAYLVSVTGLGAINFFITGKKVFPPRPDTTGVGQSTPELQTPAV